MAGRTHEDRMCAHPDSCSIRMTGFSVVYALDMSPIVLDWWQDITRASVHRFPHYYRNQVVRWRHFGIGASPMLPDSGYIASHAI
jgi:hypothetical protein